MLSPSAPLHLQLHPTGEQCEWCRCAEWSLRAQILLESGDPGLVLSQGPPTCTNTSKESEKPPQNFRLFS